ncbi:hypothetical protein [Rhizobium tubonense]|uniref:hypothetical protein n=1 Tax=Rhizobium tubonense TaxID=484088 RepID=UPI0011B48A08|nr:hypothetical protein [Rhizobium tubonense]
MLPPIRAVSSVAAPAAQTEASVVSEALSSLASEPDAAVALSIAMSAGVEGKLNMLLIAARERMVESLFAAVDAVSAALNLPQEPGETNSAFALRLADTISNLTPSQLGNVQQQVNTAVKTLPLPLIARALHDPTGVAAAQVVAYLEVVRYKDRDLATKAVVSSYGLNDGNPEASIATKSEPQAAKQIGGTTINSMLGQISSEEAPALPGGIGAPLKASPAPVVNAATSPGQGSETTSRQVLAPLGIPSQAPTDAGEPRNAKSPVVVAIQSNAISVAGEASASLIQGKLPVQAQTSMEARAQPPQAVQASVPRQIQQIEADIQEGLKVVVSLAIDAAGPDILQIMAQGEPLADKVVAQALVADMMDSVTLQSLSQADLPDPAVAPVATASPTSVAQPLPVDEKLAQVNLASTPAEGPPPPTAAPLAAMQMQPSAMSVVGVPFAIAQYLPTNEIVDEREDIFIDRVDPVDDEKHGQGQAGQPEEHEEAEGDEQTLQAADHAAEPSAEDATGNDGVVVEALKVPTEPAQLALPASPPREPLRDHAFDLYQRMVGWE